MQDDQLKSRKTARVANRQSTQPAPPIKAGPPVLPRKAAPKALPERVVAPPKALPTRVRRQTPVEQPGPQPKAAPEHRGPRWWWAQRGKIRWLVAIAALVCALAAQKIADDARVANGGAGAPPTLTWVLFGLAAVLFVIGVPGSPAPPT